MKAWVVTDEDSYEGGSAVVFAETRGKAKILARILSHGLDYVSEIIDKGMSL